MLRQNFLSKLLDLSKCSRTFLLLVTMSCFSITQLEAKRSLQTVLDSVANYLDIQTAQTTQIHKQNFALVALLKKNSDMLDKLEDNEDLVVESWIEKRADGVYDCYKYFSGKIRYFGPRPD